MKPGPNTGLYLGLAAKAFGADKLGDLALTAHNLSKKGKNGNGNGNGDKEKTSPGKENTGPNNNGADTTPPTAPKTIRGTGDFVDNGTNSYWTNNSNIA